MSAIAIRVENLSKRYRRGVPAGNDRLSEVMSNIGRMAVGAAGRWLGRDRGRAADVRSPAPDAFWALKDVSFEVEQGEVVGVIGRNGAGKSTLLKVLSRITDPTAGRFGLRGRVASLLEVGTGFHGELTGRENIFLSGTLLGMSRGEIRTQFDEIVAFAEVEDFLDTPVKRYSSGMALRLGFAVAAHLRPEILIVDEVLAVGDAAFQKKCLGKMGEVARDGRTVLFVSHDIQAVSRLCSKVVLLDHGQVAAAGPTSEVTHRYQNSHSVTTAARSWSGPSFPGNDVARLLAVRVRGESGETVDVIDIRKAVGIEMTFDVLRGGYVLIPNHHFYTEHGVCAFIVGDNLSPAWHRRPRPPGRYVSTLWVPGNFLAEGIQIVTSALSTVGGAAPVVHFVERDVVAFRVVDGGEGDSNRGDYAGPYPGVVRPRFEWETNYSPVPPPAQAPARAGMVP